MKKSLLFIFTLVLETSGLAQTSAYKSEATALTEVFSTKILKIYQAESEAGEFVAYVVDWRGQEVIVVPVSRMPGEVPKKVGDTLRCTMRSSIVPVDRSEKGRLSFSYGDALSEAARLETIASEVRQRRAERDAAAKAKESSVEKPDVKK